MGLQINQLSAQDALTAADLFVIWSSSSGDTRKVAASVLLAYLQDNLTSNGSMQTQYSRRPLDRVLGNDRSNHRWRQRVSAAHPGRHLRHRHHRFAGTGRVR
jgi:hypothetical protein